MTPEPSNEYQKLVEAVARAEAWLRQCSDWLLATDLDMQCPMETDPLDIADALSAIKLPHAGDGGWKGIETAPRDGDYVLIYVDGMAVEAKFDPDEVEWVNGKWGFGFGSPTHWRPLPTPPAGVSDNG